MGADDERRRAVREPAEDRLARLALVAAGQQDDLDPGGARQWLEGVEVLARQDFGGRHEGGLASGLHGGQHGEQRAPRLAAADVTLAPAQHAVLGGPLGGAPRSEERRGGEEGG